MNLSEIPKPKVIRAEKSENRNIDDAKVFGIGFICFLVLLVVQNWVFPNLIVIPSTQTTMVEENDQ